MALAAPTAALEGTVPLHKTPAGTPNPNASAVHPHGGSAVASHATPTAEGSPSVVKRFVGHVPAEFFAALLVTLIASVAFARAWLRERRRSRDARGESLVDRLTGIPNRLAFEKRLSHEWRRAHRYRRPMGILLLDMDNLEHVNDRHGRAAGDLALRSMAKLIAANIRDSDLAARVSGGEFAVLCPETDIHELEQLTAKLRLRLAAAAMATSAGMAEREPADQSSDDVMRRADAARYSDKARRSADHPAEARPGVATPLLPAPRTS